MLLLEDREDPRRFEPYDGRTPDWVIATHPDGSLIALKVTLGGPAAVRDRRSGKLAWRPGDAEAIGWNPGGDQVASVAPRTRSAPTPGNATPPSARLGYVIERAVWPHLRPIGGCSIELPTGWPVGVAFSPAGDTAAVAWLEQDDSGFILIRLGPDGRDVQVPGGGYRFGRHSNVSAGPVFSPDGRYALLSCTRLAWWTEDPDADEWHAPWPGGRAWLGCVGAVDTATGRRSEITVEADLPAGFLPADPDVPEAEMIGEPRFLSDREFEVALPTGWTRRLAVTG